MTSGLRRLGTDLWETSADHPAPGLHTHAYLWRSPSHGNVLFYSLATDRDFEDIDAVGGVAHQYLSHRDEAGPMLDRIAQRFDTRLHVPAPEVEEIGRHRRPDVTFEAHVVDTTGVEILPTPGHSPGSTSFVVQGASGRYLFTGDTLFRSEDGRWTAGYLPGISQLDELRESLETLANIDPPDVVASSAFAGSGGAHRIDRSAWVAHVREARAALEAAAAR